MATLDKIKSLLDELQQTKNRLHSADALALELDVLKITIVELYREVNKFQHEKLPVAAQTSASATSSNGNKFAEKTIAPTQTSAENHRKTIEVEAPKPIAETTENKKIEPEGGFDVSKQQKPDMQYLVEAETIEEVLPVNNRKQVEEELPADPVARAYALARKRAATYKDTEQKPASQNTTQKPLAKENTPIRQELKKDATPISSPEPPVKPMPNPEVEPQPTRQPEQPGIRPMPTPDIPSIPQPEPYTIPSPLRERELDPEIERNPQPTPFQPNPQRETEPQRESEPEPAVAKNAVEEIQKPTPSTEKQSINDRFAQGNVKRNLADKLKLSPITDLRTAIGLNQKIGYIKELFGGDDKEYKRVIQFLNSCKNFSEAKYYLTSDIAPQYNWDLDNPKVEEFMELVYRKFL